MTSKILFVDDDSNLLAAFQRNLRKQFTFDCAESGQQGLELLKTSGPYALLVVDMRMPVMDGIEFLEKAQDLAPEAVRMMLTGNADQQTAIDAVNRGQVFRFLNKPCPIEVLVAALETGLKHYELLRNERELLEGTLTGSVKVLSEVLGMVAPDALGRGERLRESMRKFAKFIGATPVWELEIASLLSSIGCASLPPRVLHKMSAGEDRTMPEERIVRRIPQVSHDLLVSIPRLAGVASIVLHQDKRFDGGGFPADKLSGESIPLGSRMLKILNARLNLEGDGIVKQRALETMRADAGAYDPKLLESCFACFPFFLVNLVSSKSQVFSLMVSELVVDQVVVSDITTPTGFVLIGAGNRLTPMVLQRLVNYDALGEVKQPVMVQETTAAT